MRHDKKDGLSIDIPGTFTSSTGAGADPGTSFKVYLFPAGSETATVDGADLDKVGAITGVYSYTWDITNVAVGQYYGYIMAVDTAISYPSAIEYDITDSRTTETQIDTIETTVNTINTNTDTIEATIGLGTGNIAHSIHFENQNGTPKAGMQVWLALDSLGTSLFTSKNNRTNSGGNITFYIALNTTYYVFTSESTTYATTIVRTS